MANQDGGKERKGGLIRGGGGGAHTRCDAAEDTEVCGELRTTLAFAQILKRNKRSNAFCFLYLMRAIVIFLGEIQFCLGKTQPKKAFLEERPPFTCKNYITQIFEFSRVILRIAVSEFSIYLSFFYAA